MKDMNQHSTLKRQTAKPAERSPESSAIDPLLSVFKMLANLTRQLTICGLLFLAHSAVADDIANDPFTDGSRTNTTGGDPLGLVYYRNTTSTSAPLAVSNDSAGIGTGNALLYSPNADLLKGTSNNAVFFGFPYRWVDWVK